MRYQIHRKEWRTADTSTGEQWHVIRYDPWFRPDQARDPNYFPSPLIFVRKDGVNGEWEPARVHWKDMKHVEPEKTRLFAKCLRMAAKEADELDRRAENGTL